MLTEIFDKLRVYSLRLQPDKCEFLRKEVCYLGHRITTGAVRPVEGKVLAVKIFRSKHHELAQDVSRSCRLL
jgi:hypothetical protein